MDFLLPAEFVCVEIAIFLVSFVKLLNIAYIGLIYCGMFYGVVTAA